MTSSWESLLEDRSYRLYSLSDAGCITGAESREFATDAEALLHAQRLLAGHPVVEVWQTHRFVDRLDRRRLYRPGGGTGCGALTGADRIADGSSDAAEWLRG